jgi:hypothetical protein
MPKLFTNLLIYLDFTPQKWTFGDAQLEFIERTKLGTLLLNKECM